MNISRRIFVKNGALAVAGTALFSRQIFSLEKDKHILGIQLYSVRDDMKKDPAGTLKKLADIGYKNVEHANYVDRKFYGYSASEFKKLLKDTGLEMHSGHTVMGRQHWDENKKDFTDLWKYTVDDAATVGQDYVISPWLDESYRKNYDDLKRYMEVFNKSGELCKKAGMRFGYHNHDFEFSQKLNGESVYDIILKNTDPKLVIQQLDIGNLYNGGAKAMDIAKEYPNRFLSLHVKDEVPASSGNEKYESAILGAGIVNVKDVIAIVGQHNKGVHYIIEQESYQGKSPLDCAKEDLAVMKSWGY
ncbi:MAG TPA: sugar phosphate isomerase/epimerase family protein [Chitinophagaceae bacterium]|nr:sugar phosphate isomerase/epimerase family protein [Chitinophagaceae bacterium]